MPTQIQTLTKVAWGHCAPWYAKTPPYHPGESYPELRFRAVGADANAPYALFRRLLYDLGLDRGHYGSAVWNPLGELIRPGHTVVVKPNFVLSRNQGGGPLFATVTHPSVIRAVVDYVYLAMGGEGRIIICDAPQMDCSWAELMRAQRLDTVQDFYRQNFSFDVELYDLRNFELVDSSRPATLRNRRRLPGDPAGTVLVNMGCASLFHGRDNENYYGADYDRTATISHHHGDTHQYAISRTVLESDVVVSIPKMKVHKKVGVTLNLKGIVGINTDKNYLIHFTLGAPSEGGDQVPDSISRYDRWIARTKRRVTDWTLARPGWGREFMYNVARRVYRTVVRPFNVEDGNATIRDAGNWHGNDSAWRMTGDLARILYFADAKGEMCATPQRKFFCVVDGIIGGEGNGPLAPDPKPAGCLVIGEDPLAVDLVGARIMGFDIERLRQFSIRATSNPGLAFRGPEDIEVFSNGRMQPGPDFFDARHGPMLAFRPHPGWVGQVELQDRP